MDNKNERKILEDLQKEIKSEYIGSVVPRKGRGFVLIISHPYCHEIRIDYIDKKIEIPLYFASTMCVARDFYKNIEPEKIQLKDKWTYGYAFHLSMGQKNINDTYCCWNCDCTLEEYLNFWKNNPQLLNQSDQKQRDALFEKMRALKIPENAYQEILKWSSNYEKKLNVIPEIGIYISWPLSKAIEYDKDGEFVNVLKNEINEVFNCLHCEEIFENDF